MILIATNSTLTNSASQRKRARQWGNSFVEFDLYESNCHELNDHELNDHELNESAQMSSATRNSFVEHDLHDKGQRDSLVIL